MTHSGLARRGGRVGCLVVRGGGDLGRQHPLVNTTSSQTAGHSTTGWRSRCGARFGPVQPIKREHSSRAWINPKTQVLTKCVAGGVLMKRKHRWYDEPMVWESHRCCPEPAAPATCSIISSEWTLQTCSCPPLQPNSSYLKEHFTRVWVCLLTFEWTALKETHNLFQAWKWLVDVSGTRDQPHHLSPREVLVCTPRLVTCSPFDWHNSNNTQ